MRSQPPPVDELAARQDLPAALPTPCCGVWTLDLASGEVWVTDEVRRIYGLTPDEPATRDRFAELLHPDERDHVLARLLTVASDKGRFDERHRLLLPDGTERWVHVTARVWGENLLVGATIDETERMVADRHAREYESRVQMAAVAANLGFSEWDSAGASYLDERCRDLIGASDDVANARSFWMERIHDDDRPKLEEASRLLREGRAEHLVMEYRYRHPQRGEVWLRHSTCRVHLEDSPVIRLIGALEDVTGRKRYEEDLRRHSEELAKENFTLREEVKRRLTPGHIVGRSPAIRRPLSLAEQVAATDSTALILGETGTGKERFANYIHECSRRRNRLMIVVNCSAIPTPLMESELFGREKGAYTGALSRQVGRFELAHGSTLFLDEIGELPMEVQVKLLRVLENHTIERLGSPKPITVDVRIVAATHRDLAAAVREGRFREDLYYRLNVFPIHVPPLRERREDIPALVRTFVEELTRSMGKRVDEIDPRSLDALMGYTWPGNVRELRNAVERAMILASGPVLTIDVPQAIGIDHAPPPTVAGRAEVEQVLHETSWRIRGPYGAAARLGLKPTTLESRIRKLGLMRPGTLPPEH